MISLQLAGGVNAQRRRSPGRPHCPIGHRPSRSPPTSYWFEDPLERWVGCHEPPRVLACHTLKPAFIPVNSAVRLCYWPFLGNSGSHLLSDRGEKPLIFLVRVETVDRFPFAIGRHHPLRPLRQGQKSIEFSRWRSAGFLTLSAMIGTSSSRKLAGSLAIACTNCSRRFGVFKFPRIMRARTG